MKLEGGGRKSTGRKNKQKVESVRIGQKKRRAIGRKGKKGKFDVMTNVCSKRKDENVTRGRGNEPKGQIREGEQIVEGIMSCRTSVDGHENTKKERR